MYGLMYGLARGWTMRSGIVVMLVAGLAGCAGDAALRADIAQALRRLADRLDRLREAG